MTARPVLVPLEGLRDLLFFTTPSLWEHWPFLALVREKRGRPSEDLDLGVLFDCGKEGSHSCTVFLTNILEAPGSLEELLALPREVFSSPEEVFAAGWRIDGPA